MKKPPNVLKTHHYQQGTASCPNRASRFRPAALNRLRTLTRNTHHRAVLLKRSTSKLPKKFQRAAHHLNGSRYPVPSMLMWTRREKFIWNRFLSIPIYPQQNIAESSVFPRKSYVPWMTSLLKSIEHFQWNPTLTLSQRSSNQTCRNTMKITSIWMTVTIDWWSTSTDCTKSLLPWTKVSHCQARLICLHQQHCPLKCYQSMVIRGTPLIMLSLMQKPDCTD